MAASDIQSLLEQTARAYQQADYALAQTVAHEACQKAPDSVDAWDFHGMASQELGQTKVAETSYKTALKLARSAYNRNKKDGKMALRQLFLLMRLDKKAEIEKLLAVLQERHPDSPGLKKLVSAYRLRQG